MKAASKPFQSLTAKDIMTKEVIPLSQDMPLRDAAGLLLHNHISGAPVVDAHGRCVGVLSAIDLLRLGARKGDAASPILPPLPVTCPFQTKRRTLDRGDVTLCVLPPGVCPIQVKQKNAGGEETIVCGEPHCVLVDWQLVEMEKLPTQDVRQFMTADPVTVSPTTSVRVLARMMVDVHIHRVIVVDDQQKPIGIVAGTDILAAVAIFRRRPVSPIISREQLLPCRVRDGDHGGVVEPPCDGGIAARLFLPRPTGSQRSRCRSKQAA